MVSYYEASDHSLTAYLKYLSNSDVEGLAKWLVMDAPPREIDILLAKDNIAYYQSKYDLFDYKVRENEYALSFDVYIRGFIYTIEDAKGNTFQVESRFSDGLCYPILKH
jgi:hypothetical protein